MNAWQFLQAVAKLCEERGGKLIAGHYTPAWAVPTRYGQLNVTPLDARWIAARFEHYDTGKVYDTLHGRSFNGYSGKWNILLSCPGAKPSELRQQTIDELRTRLDAVAVAETEAAHE